MKERSNEDERSRARPCGSREALRLVVERPEQLVDFRRRVRGMLRDRGVTKAEREAVVLATGEALNNALSACETDDCRVEVEVSFVEEFVCVEVRDADARFRGACLDLHATPDTAAEHGRGLFLMHTLMESLEIVPRERGTLVRMTKQLEAEERRRGDGSGDAGNGAGEAA